MSPRRTSRKPVLAALLAAVLLLAACSGSDGSETAAPTTTSPRSGGGPTTAGPDGEVDPVADIVRIEVLSSQPDRVSGDDARIRITPSSTGSVASLSVELDGTDVTDRFMSADGHLEGVLDGLVEGTNSLTVRGDGDPVTLRLRAWPLQGPMISGPQRPLPVCTTEEHGLGEAGRHCAADRRVTFRRLRADGTIEDLDGPVDPAELGEDTLVRVERGVVDRSVYEIAIPVRTAEADPDAPVEAAWDGTLVHRFEDGCGATHSQGSLRARGTDAGLLARGHAVATATFNDGSVTCDDVVSAETVMMVSERFIEAVGVPERTIGLGRGLGGGQVHLLTQNYPDLLDAGVTVGGFPDLASFANEMSDCLLLRSYFDGPGAELDEQRRRAITGHGDVGTCDEILDRYGAPFDPSRGCDDAIPEDEVYGPGRPGGIRCTMQDASIVAFGTDPVTGHAVRPVDNTGVQYGLGALLAGDLSMGEFLDLNERIGGLGPDGELTGERSDVPSDQVERFYETGRILEGTGDSGAVPFIDIVPLDPGPDPGDLHRALAFRYRVERIVGGRSLQQIWQLEQPDDAAVLDAIEALVGWMEDGRPDPDDVPESVVSRCDRPEAKPLLGLDVFDLGGTGCIEEEPASDPRLVAGAFPTGDVIKCVLRPIDPWEYPSPPTDTQLRRLERIFPEGVCDRSSPGAGQTLPASPDRSFAEEESPADLA